MVLCALVGAGPALAANQAVSVTNFAFTPADVTVGVDETVTWTNRGGNHNVVFDNPFFAAPMTPSSAMWIEPRTFTTPGTFAYYCAAHRDQMTGAVTVTATALPPGGTPPPGAPPPPGGTPPPATETPTKPTTITLRVSDTTPRSGRLVRFFGSVSPADDGRSVRIQKRGRRGSFKTIAQATLRDAGEARSSYTRRLRVTADGVFRARFGAALSRTRRLDVSP